MRLTERACPTFVVIVCIYIVVFPHLPGVVLDSSNARGAVNFVLVFGAGKEQDLADNVTDATHAAATTPTTE